MILFLQMQRGDKETINGQEGVKSPQGGGDQSRERGKGKWTGFSLDYLRRGTTKRN